jgi:uncharacterized protein YoxC
MTAPVAEDTTSYVDQKSLDVLLQTLIDRIQESDEANRERIDEVRKDVTAAIQQSEARNLAATQQLVDERIAKEKAERKSDIDSLASELRTFAKDINGNIGDMQRGVSHITGLMESLPKQLQTRDEKDIETHKRIEARIDEQNNRLANLSSSIDGVKRDNELLTSNQANLSNENSRIRATIHGDPENKDDAPSLFKMMGELKDQMTSGFTNVGSRLDLTTEQLGQARADIAIINKERTLEKAQWSQRWDTARTISKELLKSRWVQLAIGALLAGVAMSVFPELRPQLVQTLLDQLQSGGN